MFQETRRSTRSPSRRGPSPSEDRWTRSASGTPWPPSSCPVSPGARKGLTASSSSLDELNYRFVALVDQERQCSDSVTPQLIANFHYAFCFSNYDATLEY